MIVKLVIVVLILLIFIYSKIKSYQDQLFPKYKSALITIRKIIEPILNILNSFCKPIKIGDRIFIDSSQFVLLLLLLLLLLRF